MPPPKLTAANPGRTRGVSPARGSGSDPHRMTFGSATRSQSTRPSLARFPTAAAAVQQPQSFDTLGLSIHGSSAAAHGPFPIKSVPSLRGSGPMPTGGGGKATQSVSPPAKGPAAIGTSSNATRVSRLLRDARAAVQAPFRPDTPLDLLSPPTYSRAPLKGRRLTALRAPTAATVGAGGTGGSDDVSSPLVSSTTQLSSSECLAALRRAEGDPPAQARLLRMLMQWLANPANRLHAGLLSHLQQMLQRINETPLEAVSESDAGVAAVAVSVIIHNTDTAECSVLPSAVYALGVLVDLGMYELLEQELMFEPLLHLLRTESLVESRPETVLTVLEILRSCTEGGTTDAAARMTQLVTLGAIPTINAFTERVLVMKGDPADSGHHGGVTTAAAETAPGAPMLRMVCLVYRNFSADFSHHLARLGTLDILLRILDECKADPHVVLAASRALTRAADDGECCAFFQKSVRLARAVAATLSAHLDTPPGPLAVVHERVMVSRLCGLLARTAEGCPEQQDFLALNHTTTLETLVRRYVRPDALTLANTGPVTTDAAVEEEGCVSLLQGVVWLVGIVAISPHCNPAFVTQVLPPLVNFVKEANLSTHNRLTSVYTLMCISNLSYFFSAIEARGADPQLEELLSTLGLTVAGFLFEGDVEAAVEATRILGNMSFTNTGRDWIEANRCDEVVIIFLGHEDLRVVYNCFGVVLNLTAATSCRITSDPELLSMLLQYTGRYTRRADIDAAAAEEKRLRLRAKNIAGYERLLTEAEATAASQAADDGDASMGYAEQIADLVEKVLANVQGLLGL